MRNLLFLLFAALLVGCSASEREPGSPQQLGLSGLASPGELAERMPPRTASGPHSPLVRTLQSDGAQFVPGPGFSANAEVSGDDALIHGGTSALNYVLYELGQIVGSSDTLTELRIDYSWDNEPAAGEGLYIGLPDHARDRWVWLDAETARAQVLDIAQHSIRGQDAPQSSFIALVNYSASSATIDKLALRFTTPETVVGDEWLYFSTDMDLECIHRVRLGGGEPEVVLSAPGVRQAVPEVINYAGEWKLNYARVDTSLQEMWRSDIDGSDEELVFDSSPANPAAHLFGTDRGLFISVIDSTIELWGYSSSGLGRLSRAGDSFQNATWDLSADPGVEFAAIAAMHLPEGGSALVSLSGNSPFPIDAEPVEIYTRLPEERAQEPEMVEIATLAGEPLYYIYFSARNRDSEVSSIYRLRYPGGYEPEPVLVEAEVQLRQAAVSPDGKWLAYNRYAEQSSITDTGEIWITSLLDPAAAPTLLVTESLYSFSWYDPSP